MVILLFGPPGCGKGTQGAIITRQLGVPSISTGEIFRAELKAGTHRSATRPSRLWQAAAWLATTSSTPWSKAGWGRPIAGRASYWTAIRARSPRRSFLDGLLKELGYPEPTILFFEVADAVLISRLTARRQCPVCGTIYNLLSQPPRKDGGVRSGRGRSHPA